MADFENKYELWKNRLLDTGRRNRLVNFKGAKLAAVRIVDPDHDALRLCDVLYKRIAVDEKSVVFPYEEAVVEAGAEPETADLAYDAKNLYTDKQPAELERALRNIRRRAKTALEEQGVNMLFLAFGFLRYPDPDQPEEVLRAPLILVPVSLKVESFSDPYTLSPHEDEITVNPTLRFKLETEYGVTLPEPDEAALPSEYFAQVREAVQSKGWTVAPDVYLGLFSFLKLNMYEDLRRNRETVLENPVIRAICGDASGLPELPGDLADYDFDRNEKPEDVFQILDADSSQQEAILAAIRGVSFVLQGPPGTGKSQTIANIIAEKIARGQKVLFVSEKMAALEVVHRRLKAVKLDDFCLVLHSHKANKRDTLDQLEASLNLSEQKVVLTEEAKQELYRLQKDREKLNAYVVQLHTPVPPLGITLYEANGAIANLQPYPDLIFEIPNVGETTREALAQAYSLLKDYADVTGELACSIRTNPWRGCTLTILTNEFRHDVGSRLPALAGQLRAGADQAELIRRKTGFERLESIADLDAAIGFVACLETPCRIPEEWLQPGRLEVLRAQATVLREEQDACLNGAEQLLDMSRAVTTQRVPCAQNPAEYLDPAFVAGVKAETDRLLASAEPFPRFEGADLNMLRAFLRDAEGLSGQIAALRNEILQAYEQEVFSVDYAGIRARIKTDYRSPLYFLSSGFKADRRALAASLRRSGKQPTLEEMQDITEKLSQLDTMRGWYLQNRTFAQRYFGAAEIDERADYQYLQRVLNDYEALRRLSEALFAQERALAAIAAEAPSAEAAFPFGYAGVNTDWDAIFAAMQFAEVLRERLCAYDPGADVVSRICADPAFAGACFAAGDEMRAVLRSWEPACGWFCALFGDARPFDGLPLPEFADRVDLCRTNLKALEEWIVYKRVCGACEAAGLGDYIRIVERDVVPTEDLIPVFRKRFFRLWLDAVLPDYPEVYQFRGVRRERLIEEFARLDSRQLRIAQARIRAELIAALPTLNDHFTNGGDEVGILKRELKKQRKIMPIRKLFSEIPNLLTTLKPCLMMSPLSVSLFLQSDCYRFDTVIFDEASQVYTENAIGAICRGRQVIIAGDSKQLPPTNFFRAMSSDSDYDAADDTEEETDAYESVLDEASLLPERTLRWHYRSRNEGLIAFSNAKIYRNSLITFPSNSEKASGCGVEYVYVPEGFYDRGGRNGNVPEAQRVAELVMEHFRTRPDRSLGVIAFGEVQQNVIEDRLRDLRREDPTLERFFDEENEEPFFVKNLENVQGDERDTIIFSIGYAKDAAGVFRNQFGPLGKTGGERRLNVAITRAKYNVKLVGSVQPTDIELSRVNSEGPKLLRAYIDYAIRGAEALGLEPAGDEAAEGGDAFEEAVRGFLAENGCSVSTQVGCSAFRIDMAVRDPASPDTYALGVVCDGAPYRAVRTARERDRLRPAVLEKMGWRLYRVWSTDWIKDPVSEGSMLLEAVEDALEGTAADGAGSPEPRAPEGEETPCYIVEDRAGTAPDPVARYGFIEKTPYGFSDLPRGEDGYLQIEDCIIRVVYEEYPIHYELLCQRLAPLYGNEKTTVKVRREVDRGLEALRGAVRRDGDFLYPAQPCEIPVRYPNDRPIRFVSVRELAAAMLRILPSYFGATHAVLSAETARVYGFERMGPNIAAAMEEAIRNLLQNGLVTETEGKLQIVKQPEA